MFECNNSKLDKVVFEQYMNHTSKSIKSLHDDQMMQHKDLMATDNYIEKYLPFKILNYMHDSSKGILPQRQFGKMITYLHGVYDHLEYFVTNDDGKPRYPKREYIRPQLDMTLAIPTND